jgi:3-phytase
MTHRARLIALTAALAACSQRAPAPAGEPEVPVLAAARETAPTAEDGANGVTIWVHPDDAARSLILGAGGTGGLEVYGLDGALRQRIPDIEAAQVMVRYGFDFGGKRAPLVLAYDPVRSALVGFTIEQERLRRLPGAPVLADDELTGLCGFTSPITGRMYALGMTDSGQMLQWELFAKSGELQARLVRSVALGKGVEYCAVDDPSATMYYGDEALGVMSLPVGPETDPTRVIVDLAAPRGGIAEEVKGVTLAQAADGKAVLIVSDTSAERFSAYDLGGKLIGRFRIGGHLRLRG